VRYGVLMLAAAGLSAAALVDGPKVAAHELDSEQPITREQELAKDLTTTTVLKINQKNPSNMKSAMVKDRLAPGQSLPKGIKFEALAKNAELVAGIAFDSGRAPKEGDDMSSTASWGFFPRGGFTGGFVRGPYGGSAGFIRGPNGGSIGWARRGWGGGWVGGWGAAGAVEVGVAGATDGTSAGIAAAVRAGAPAAVAAAGVAAAVVGPLRPMSIAVT
jgi:hypothetical protein